MSKHRHKSRDINRMRNPSFNNYMNNNPFGINPQQLLGLLGSNIDMTGLGNILSSMGQEGFNLNSVNTQPSDRTQYNNINDVVNSSEVDTSSIKQEQTNDDILNDDDNIKFLESIKAIVSVDRAKFIDKVIDLYKTGAFKDFN